MSKEEVKEYLKRVDELELKLTDEDKDTYQWLLFGYNECARLLNEKEQENKQLKEVIEEVRELLDKSVVVPDKEGQEELWWTEKYLCCGDELINRFYEILDKVKGE